MVYLHNIHVSKWEAGSRGEHTSKWKMLINLFLYLFTVNKFALIHVSMIRMCNKVKTKASILQQYLLCLVVYQKIETKTKGNYVFSSLNISGVRKCKC